MSDRVLFVYDNLKVTLNPGDAPYYGFEILAGEAQCSVTGTLYDMGHNAGFFPSGNTQVRGQVWLTYNSHLIQELKELIDPKGNVRISTRSVTITEEQDKLVIPAMIFELQSAPHFAKIVDSGYWVVRDYKMGR